MKNYSPTFQDQCLVSKNIIDNNTSNKHKIHEAVRWYSGQYRLPLKAPSHITYY